MSRTQQAHERLAEEIARLFAASADLRARARLLAEYETAHARAREARLSLVIQREAIGLRQHRVVEQQFPEPPRRPGAPWSAVR